MTRAMDSRPVTAKFEGGKKPLGFAGSRAMKSEHLSIANLNPDNKT